ncbi:hypothetical protein HMPREF9057_01839 [Actinomyces sp. oral taxon 171 str. F0337]|nr:hypothetical protein HMPREF9057_01839 [Actinomyces sp. oral taxon 171 str. F0337]
MGERGSSDSQGLASVLVLAGRRVERADLLWLTLTGTGVGDGFSTVDPLFSC